MNGEGIAENCLFCPKVLLVGQAELQHYNISEKLITIRKVMQGPLVMCTEGEQTQRTRTCLISNQTKSTGSLLLLRMLLRR